MMQHFEPTDFKISSKAELDIYSSGSFFVITTGNVEEVYQKCATHNRGWVLAKHFGGTGHIEEPNVKFRKGKIRNYDDILGRYVWADIRFLRNKR